MYIVTISNNGIETPIHNEREKLHSGKVVKGINTIDSFTFSILPSNAGFNLINEFTTLVTVYNTNKKRYDFIGRVLYPETRMDADGLITKEVTCESIFAYLCDSQQAYVNTKNWTVRGLLQHLIDCHNSQVEEYKRFAIGEVTATDANDNLYLGIQRANTWTAINEKLIKQIGGELRYRVEDGVIYIDYLEQLGETRSTAIELSVNMKSITREKDPTAYVTRLIPLGAKLSEDTEERLDISSVNDGKNYIDDETAIAVYGIHVGYVEFDDVTTPSNLFNKGMAWMVENNKVQIKYSITALDLSLIGLAIDDLDVCDYHPIKNALLGIDDTARIIKKTIDICEEVKSTIEMGDNFKTLSDIQQEQAEKAAQNIQQIQSTQSALQTEVSNTMNTVSKLETKIEGIDGTFFYIRYSAYSDGHIMTETPQADTLYMGTCSTNQETAPTDSIKYTWCMVKGTDGSDAVVCRIDSSGGYTLKADDSVTLTAHVFVGTDEIDPNGEYLYTWFKRVDGGNYVIFGYGKTVEVKENAFNENMDVYFVCSETYAFVDYIETTGTQYIDTGFIPNQDTRIVCEFMYIGGDGIYGARVSTATDNFALRVISGQWQPGYNDILGSTSITADKEWHVADQNKNKFSMDGVSVREFTYADFTTRKPIALGGINANNRFYYGSGRYRSCKIYDNGVLVRDMVACINANGEVGMFDKVNGVFYGNKGTGTFIYPELTEQGVIA